MRFTLSLSEEEGIRLNEIIDWFEETRGVRLSKNKIVRSLLFDAHRKTVDLTRELSVESGLF